MAEALARVLNVNDHEQTRYMCTRMLGLAGFEVIEAATGEEALLQARGRSPDIIVLDVKLPDMSGFEVCRLIKSAADTSSICVLQTSATFVTVDKKIEGLESGADAYLTHPFEPAELIATVRALLRIRAAERELRRRADELVEADKKKDEFLAMLAHELRNPLAAITTAMPLLRRYCDEPDRRERFDGIVAVIERQSRHLARLIDDLLDVSRFSRGMIELRRATIDLRRPIEDALAASRPVYAAREQELVTKLPPEPRWAVADAARLQQVLANLIDNASKYSERGTRVSVEMSDLDRDGRRFARVVVRDQGIGIEPALLPHVFELFVQADHSLERTRGGMGIGLTLVKRLVELHGGQVAARSDGLGQGSELELQLPLTAAPVTEAPAPIERRARPPAPRSILVVEDNTDAREMLQAVREVAGHRVEVARDGLGGVERALAGRHDVAIVDIGLPGLNGYEVAQRIRAGMLGRAGRPLYLVALTGYGGREQRDRALGAGFDIHIVKPVDPDTLLRLIDDVEA